MVISFIHLLCIIILLQQLKKDYSTVEAILQKKIHTCMRYAVKRI